MNSITEKISQSINIADIISETVKLRPSRHGYVGLCPFHHEDTPSFHVYTDTNSYYCFGCHRGGNIFTYVMTRENINFSEALRLLADRAGITLNDEHSHRQISRDILKLTEDFFCKHLNSSNLALSYLQKRSLTKSDIQKFKLGYAPDAWDTLTLYLRSHGLSDKAVTEAGLSVQWRGGVYDRFRGRIIFPVHDITGRIIAFGGRLITGEGAKYINSPESEIYHKRKNLYLLDMARNAIREKKRSILCEGYMDAIRLHKTGFTESVASLGTSLTAEQAELLSRYADTCYICYDSDTAGQNAAIRGMYILQSNGLEVRVINLPEGKDPDEYLLTHSAGDFEQLIAQAKPLVLAHIASMREMLEDSATHKSAVKELIMSLRGLRASEVLEYKSQICEATRILPSELDKMLISEKPAVIEPVMPAEHKSADDELECALCALMMRDGKLRIKISTDEVMKIISSPEVQDLALSILNEDISNVKDIWLQTGDMNKFGMLQRGDILCRQLSGLSDDEKYTHIYSALKRASIERRINEIKALPEAGRNYMELNALYLEREKYGR